MYHLCAYVWGGCVCVSARRHNPAFPKENSSTFPRVRLQMSWREDRVQGTEFRGQSSGGAGRRRQAQAGAVPSGS